MSRACPVSLPSYGPAGILLLTLYYWEIYGAGIPLVFSPTRTGLGLFPEAYAQAPSMSNPISFC
uniref:Uncharacterized protein n=1 Tax=Mus spicilegus TaxID=10103 RepID=A0A8C6H8L4_MUSSI